MLVISSNMVLSEAEAALPAGTPLILWDNLVTSSNVVADTQATGYPISNVGSPATDPTQEWRGADTTAQELTISVNAEVAAVGIARHNFGTAGIAVEVGYYNADSPPVWVNLSGPQIPANDEPLLFWFTLQSLASVVVKLASGSAAPRIAVLYCGPTLTMERGFAIENDFTPPRFGRKSDVINGRSERGDYLGRIRVGQWLESECAFKHLRPDWYRTYFDPFVVAAAEDVPFFFAWAPDDYPYEVGYCWFFDDPMPQVSPVTRRHSVSLKLGGILE